VAVGKSWVALEIALTVFDLHEGRPDKNLSQFFNCFGLFRGDAFAKCGHQNVCSSDEVSVTIIVPNQAVNKVFNKFKTGDVPV